MRFTDDPSFEDGEPAYKALKSVLDGSLAAVPDNVLIYATSNRRHLMPEYFEENLEALKERLPAPLLGIVPANSTPADAARGLSLPR